MRRPSAPFAPPAEGEAPKGLHRRLSEGGCVTLESCGQRLGARTSSPDGGGLTIPSPKPFSEAARAPVSYEATQRE